MTREEAKRLIMVITYTYPNYKPNDLSLAVDIWAELLSDYQYEDIAIALKSFIATDTSGFAPSIGQLIAKYQDMSRPVEMSEMEIWDAVRRAISDSTYHSEERFSELPQIAQKCVGSPNQLRVWATDPGYNENVTQSNFLKTYREILKRAKEYERLPLNIQNIISATNNKMIESKGD